jgi:L-asparaginase / beta-aspartyl-peptidase
MPKLGPTALIVHGGAGSRGPADERRARKRAIMNAIKAGASILRDGGSALDAVIACVVILEDDPLFNAGYGSTLNGDGVVEMDASVMIATPARDDTRRVVARAGAVAAVTRVKNPVRLARAIMEHTPHVMMAGSGAERIAREWGIELCNPEDLIAPRVREKFLARIQRQTKLEREEHGTVGAAALDIHRQLAAATSTGGVPGKIAGRVGDSAIIGAGTFASAAAAASATGHGEAIIMASLCRETVEAIGKSDLSRIARRKIAEMIATRDSEAGIILVDRRGRIGYAHNAETMEVGIFHSTGGMRHEWAAPMPTSRQPRK